MQYVFSIHGAAIQVSVLKCKHSMAMLGSTKEKNLRKLNRYYKKRRLKTGRHGIYFLHDNASSYKASIVAYIVKILPCRFVGFICNSILSFPLLI